MMFNQLPLEYYLAGILYLPLFPKFISLFFLCVHKILKNEIWWKIILIFFTNGVANSFPEFSHYSTYIIRFYVICKIIFFIYSNYRLLPNFKWVNPQKKICTYPVIGYFWQQLVNPNKIALGKSSVWRENHKESCNRQAPFSSRRYWRILELQ
jgi:hypothetical protein